MEWEPKTTHRELARIYRLPVAAIDAVLGGIGPSTCDNLTPTQFEACKRWAAEHRRPVRRETNGCVYSRCKARPVIVTIDCAAGLIGFRLKGEKRQYQLPADYLYKHACQRAVAAEKAAKRKAKKEQRRG